jgi:hypothetical protein
MWKLVSEEMPKDGQPCLVLWGDYLQDACYAYWADDENWNGDGSPGYWVVDGMTWDGGPPKYWMPFPKVPNKVK